MKPFWENAEHGLRIYHGDCLEVLPELEAAGERFDLCLTDPPYGIDLDTDYRGMSTHSQRGTSRRYNPVIGDDRPFDFAPYAGWSMREQLWWGANYYANLPLGGSWFVWDKRVPANDAMFGSCFEICWSKAPHKQRMLRYPWAGALAKEVGEDRIHPTQKPVMMFQDLLRDFAQGPVIDPFLGSGTTLVAAYRLGRHATGIEISEEYCELAARRLEAELAQGRLFEPAEVAQPRQEVLAYD
jgi:site-specific DNA-methyltransferase (adenine-specific)